MDISLTSRFRLFTLLLLLAGHLVEPSAGIAEESSEGTPFSRNVIPFLQ